MRGMFTVLLGLRDHLSTQMITVAPDRTKLFRPRRPCIRSPYSHNAREWVAYLSQGVTQSVGALHGTAWRGKANQTGHLSFVSEVLGIIADNLSKAGWSWGCV